MRVVIDTNVLVSGLFWKGPSASILDAATRQAFHLLITEELLDELREVLSRPQFESRLTARGRTVTEVMDKQRILSTLVVSSETIAPPELRDLKDLPVLRCAVGGKAQSIVTGDKDLLTLGEFQGILIVTPRIFLTSIGE